MGSAFSDKEYSNTLNSDIAKNLNRYCAFCRTPLRVFPKKSISGKNIFFSGLLAFLIMLVIWQQMDARFLLFWVVILGGAEVFIQLRWRMSIICNACGFDPVIYLKNSEEAVKIVKARLDLRQTHPKYLLAPKLNLPMLTKSSRHSTPRSLDS